jgi:hypothetical protein
MDEGTLDKLRDLSEIVGESVSDVLRDLIVKAHKKLTPAMIEQIDTQRTIQKSVRARLLG